MATIAVLLTLLPGCSDEPLPVRLHGRLQKAFDQIAPGATPDELQQALLRQLRTTSEQPTRATLEDFYARIGSRHAWADEAGRLLPRVDEALAALGAAREHGLDPADYAPDRLQQMRAQLSGKASSDETDRLAEFDLVLTATVLRYASDLATGRMHPAEVDPSWHTKPPQLDLTAMLAEAIERGTFPAFLEELPPPHPGYQKLREALGRLKEIAAAGDWPVVPDGPKLGRGARGPRVAALRARLLGESEPAAFDEALTGAVREFQRQHGIEPDGIVGSATLAELNVPIGERIRSIERNLERWRWVPRRMDEPFLIVNIPAFELRLVQDGATAWRTRIVAGKAYTPTPIFSDRLVAVVANPPWNVPDSIAVDEYLPELRRDPRALEAKNIRVLEGSGDDAREVNPRSVRWDRVEGEKFPYRLRQDPGSDNALGRVKFELTNDFGIYLHDTPARSLFGQVERDFSHGCVRVENPLELAARVLGENRQDSLREALAQPETRRLPLPTPLPIYILYWTAWIDDGGELSFGPDVYGFDAAQEAGLARVRSSASG